MLLLQLSRWDRHRPVPVCAHVRAAELIPCNACYGVELRVRRGGAGRGAVSTACSNGRGSLRICLASTLHVKCCRGQGVAVRHRKGMFLPSSRSSLQRGPEIIWDHQRAFFFFFLTPLHLLLPLHAGSASVKFTPLNLFHLHYDWMKPTPTGTEKCMTTHRRRLRSTAKVLESMLLTGLHQRLIAFPIVPHSTFQHAKKTGFWQLFHASADTVSAAWDQQVAA